MPTPATSTQPQTTTSTALAQAGQAALTAAAAAGATALQQAAENAAKPGSRSTEWKAVLGSLGFGALVVALKALSVIPSPLMVPAIVISASMSVATGMYAVSRGNVKAAALAGAAQAAGAVAQALPKPPIPPTGG